jgi:hypothetical protein
MNPSGSRLITWTSNSKTTTLQPSNSKVSWILFRFALWVNPAVPQQRVLPRLRA